MWHRIGPHGNPCCREAQLRRPPLCMPAPLLPPQSLLWLGRFDLRALYAWECLLDVRRPEIDCRKGHGCSVPAGSWREQLLRVVGRPDLPRPETTAAC